MWNSEFMNKFSGLENDGLADHWWFIGTVAVSFTCSPAGSLLSKLSLKDIPVIHQIQSLSLTQKMVLFNFWFTGTFGWADRWNMGCGRLGQTYFLDEWKCADSFLLALLGLDVHPGSPFFHFVWFRVFRGSSFPWFQPSRGRSGWCQFRCTTGAKA